MIKKEELNFDDPKIRDAAISNFTTLLAHPGWQLLVMIVEGNMELIKDQILDGTGETETKDFIDRLRDRLKIHKSIIETPQTIIDKLKPQESSEEIEDDPYPKVERT